MGVEPTGGLPPTVWGTLKERQSVKKKGVEFTEEHKKHLSQAMKGNTNRKGKKNTKKHNSLISKSHRKAVICDGKKFSSIKSAATYYDYNYRTFANWIEGKRQMPEKFKSMSKVINPGEAKAEG